MAEEKVAPVSTPPVSEEARTREEIYKQYAEANGGVPEEPKETAAPEEAKPEPEKVEDKTAAEPEKVEPVKEPAQDKPKEEKTVPYNALHEERLKRQAEQKLRKEVEARAKALEDELAKSRTQQPQTEEITDYEKELIELKREQKAMKSVLEQEQVVKQENARKDALKQFNDVMVQIDTELKAEGIAGFTLAKNEVADEIKRLLEEDESNYIHDNKEGWKKIYQEKFYPKYREEFMSVEKERETSEKKELKKGAALGTIPGKAPAKPKSVDDMSPEEMRRKYLEERNKREF